MYFRVVQPSREAFAFQVVLSDGQVCLSSVSFPDRAGALGGIQAVIASLREGVEASLEVDGDQYRCSIRGADGATLATGARLSTPSEVDAQLADLQHWVATVERFRIEEPPQAKAGAKPAETTQVAVGYDLEQRSQSRTPGLELLNRASDKLFSAQINDERGEGLLFMQGFATRFARDEQIESLLQAAAEARRYDRREADGRLYFVVNTRNGRELARSRWFDAAAERDAAIAWLMQLAPGEGRNFAGRAQREGAGDDAKPAQSRPAGFEGFRGADGQHYFRLNDEDGEEVLCSHGYASAKARDNGIRSLLKAATDPICYRIAADGTSFTLLAVNSRQLAKSRSFAGRAETEGVIAWIRREVIRFGKACGIRIWESMIIEIPHDDEASRMHAPPPSTHEVVDQPLRNLRVDVAPEPDATGAEPVAEVVVVDVASPASGEQPPSPEPEVAVVVSEVAAPPPDRPAPVESEPERSPVIQAESVEVVAPASTPAAIETPAPAVSVEAPATVVGETPVAGEAPATVVRETPVAGEAPAPAVRETPVVGEPPAPAISPPPTSEAPPVPDRAVTPVASEAPPRSEPAPMPVASPTPEPGRTVVPSSTAATGGAAAVKPAEVADPAPVRPNPTPTPLPWRPAPFPAVAPVRAPAPATERPVPAPTAPPKPFVFPAPPARAPTPVLQTAAPKPVVGPPVVGPPPSTPPAKPFAFIAPLRPPATDRPLASLNPTGAPKPIATEVVAPKPIATTEVVAPKPAAEVVAPKSTAMEVVAPKPAAEVVAPKPAVVVTAPKPIVAAEVVAPKPIAAAEVVAPKPAVVVAAPKPAVVVPAPKPVAAAEVAGPKLAPERPLAPIGAVEVVRPAAERAAPQSGPPLVVEPVAPKMAPERPLASIEPGGVVLAQPRPASPRVGEPDLLGLTGPGTSSGTASFIPTMVPLVLERSGPNTRAARDENGARAQADLKDMYNGDARGVVQVSSTQAQRRSLPTLIPSDMGATQQAQVAAPADANPTPASSPTANVVPAPSTRAPSQPRTIGPGRGIDRRLLGGSLLVLILVVAAIFAVRGGGRSERSGDAGEVPAKPEEPVTPSVAPTEPAPELAERTPELGGCPADGADDPAIGVVVAPSWPLAGEPLRVLAATLADERPISLRILGEDDRPIAVDVRTTAGVPSAAIATWTPPAPGVFRIAVGSGASRVCRELRVEQTREGRSVSAGPGVVWPVERAWTSGEEALYSAWVRELFAAPREAEANLARLDVATGDPARNLLHDALGLGEDWRTGDLRLAPDGADLPYFLRAYFAWKRRLPFAFRPCSWGRPGQAPRCVEPRSNLAPGRGALARGGELARVRRFFQRTLPWSVHAGNARTAIGDAKSDFYPVKIDRRGLRPGTTYTDPQGQVLVVVELADPREGGPGVLHVIDGGPDGALTRTRFWEGAVPWDPDPALGGTGFKHFRPVVAGPAIVQLDDASITRSQDHADLWTGHAELDARGFHDAVAAVIEAPPWDPARTQREAVQALMGLVQARVDAVARGAAQAAGRRRPIPMPRGPRLFDARGAWEKFSTPGRDLRLLVALDVVRAVPDRVRERPDQFVTGSDAAAVATSLEQALEAMLRDQRFTYQRSDGSAWELSLADLAARGEALERAYNPNDCPERRWGAPAGSDEASTCSFRAPAVQQARMEQHRGWFRARRPPSG